MKIVFVLAFSCSTLGLWLLAFNEADIDRAAKELVERHGSNAVTVARERVDGLSKTHHDSGLDVALRILSACERLVQTS